MFHSNSTIDQLFILQLRLKFWSTLTIDFPIKIDQNRTTEPFQQFNHLPRTFSNDNRSALWWIYFHPADWSSPLPIDLSISQAISLIIIAIDVDPYPGGRCGCRLFPQHGCRFNPQGVNGYDPAPIRNGFIRRFFVLPLDSFCPHISTRFVQKSIISNQFHIITVSHKTSHNVPKIQTFHNLKKKKKWSSSFLC